MGDDEKRRLRNEYARRWRAGLPMSGVDENLLTVIPGLPNYRATGDGRIWSNSRAPRLGWYELKPTIDKRYGYRLVGVYGKTRLVHCLVALAFLGPRPSGMDVRHLNGCKADNRSANLAYGTRKENEEDKARHGKKPLGERVGGSKLKNFEVLQILNRLKSGESQTSIALELDVDPSTVSDIFTGASWSHLTKVTRSCEHGR